MQYEGEEPTRTSTSRLYFNTSGCLEDYITSIIIYLAVCIKLCLLFSVMTALVSHYYNFIQRQRLDPDTDIMSSLPIILTTKDSEAPQSTQDKPPAASSTRQTSRKGKAPEVALLSRPEMPCAPY